MKIDYAARLRSSIGYMMRSRVEGFMRKILGTCLALCIFLGLALATCLLVTRLILHHVFGI